MRILITGGSGFLGSHIADLLLRRGDHVLVIDNFATGRRDNLEPHPNLRVVEGSIADHPLLKGAFDDFRPTHVIHAAASYKDPSNWGEDITTNVLGTAHVVKESKDHGVSRFIYFQTALCYGLHPSESPISIHAGIDPRGSSYAISKTSAEHYIELGGLNFVSFRLANIFGPRNISGPLPTFFQRLATGKKCFIMDTRRDFVYVEDLIQLVEKAIDGVGDGYYHVSSGHDISIKELFETTVKAMGISLSEQPEVRAPSEEDATTILLDPMRTIADFDWRATTPFETGVTRAIAYYSKFGVTQTFTHLKVGNV